eukprot:TRINITY_DN6368_c0_g1_i2.p1 TRINITY_DN6368_c0_g1~~TRINITY_DN6368_c0_g1_i2.p1  ORF type:complete len:204 (-),score=13.84 TRINITY_DN6368_c0_g1_i2:118-729(-)
MNTAHQNTKKRQRPEDSPAEITTTINEDHPNKKYKMNVVMEYHKENGGDYCFVVDNREFYVHSAILNIWSTEFSKMSANCSNGGQNRIVLEGIDKGSFETFLNKIYPPCKLEIDDHNVEDLLTISDKFGSDELEFQCISALESMQPSIKIALMADRYRKYSGPLLDRMIDWMAKNFEMIRLSPMFTDLSKSTIIEVHRKVSIH